jgi:hypothetical protein
MNGPMTSPIQHFLGLKNLLAEQERRKTLLLALRDKSRVCFVGPDSNLSCVLNIDKKLDACRERIAQLLTDIKLLDEELEKISAEDYVLGILGCTLANANKIRQQITSYYSAGFTTDEIKMALIADM